MDFKGYFAIGDGKRCDPFTITDAYSRYLIRCQIVSRMASAKSGQFPKRPMREHGVPARIRTDNGAPFAGRGLLGLSKLSLGWMKLGIVHERIQPSRPQQNARHERMHRTLKDAINQFAGSAEFSSALGSSEAGRISFATEHRRFVRLHEEMRRVSGALQRELQSKLSEWTRRRYQHETDSEPHVDALIQMSVEHYAAYSDTLRTGR